MLPEIERRFLETCRVGHLATADNAGVPHVVPVCFVVLDDTLYITIDDKPKRRDVPLKRLSNIAVNNRVAFVVDRYDEDWSRLGWVMLRGHADILESGPEHEEAQIMLRARYPQLRAMRIEALPVIAVRLARVTRWGDLSDAS